jgi:DNA end-binding protein Ku
LKQQNIDAETGAVVPREDTARGYEVAKGQYLIVEDEGIEAVQVESTRTIDIDQFVPRNEIDDRYIDSPYYIAPDGQVGQDAFAVVRDTIGKLNMVALGRVVPTRREHAPALGALSLRCPIVDLTHADKFSSRLRYHKGHLLEPVWSAGLAS